jgi:hypothetical protein
MNNKRKMKKKKKVASCTQWSRATVATLKAAKKEDGFSQSSKAITYSMRHGLTGISQQ